MNDALTPETTYDPLQSARIAPPPAPISKPGMKKVPIIVLGTVFLVCSSVVLFLYSRGNQEPSTAEIPTPAPTLIPTPTPQRILTSIATTDTFELFRSSVASLSAGFDGFTLQDPTLIAPSLNLDLGLSGR